MKKNNEKELQRKKYERLQGEEWAEVKDDMKLLYTYTSDKGNIKGIYVNTKTKQRVSHWLNDNEIKAYKEEIRNGNSN